MPASNAAYKIQDIAPAEPIVPTIPQDDFIFCGDPYPAFVAGFGAGKTEALIVRALMGKIAYPNNDRAFYEPTYDLMRVIAWPRFEELLTQHNMPYKLFRQPYNVLHVEGAGRIIFRSMDVPSRIIGYQVADSDIDELDTLKRDDAAEVWRRCLSRNRQNKPDKSPNTIGVATTPEGFRFVWEMWKKNPPPGYRLIKAPTYSNPHLPESYIQSLRDVYPENLINAYIEGEFVNLTQGTVYTSYDREACRSRETIQKGEPLYVGMDFNVTKQCAVVYVKRKAGRLTALHAVDELIDYYDTPAIAEAILDRYPKHRVTVYPDASGNSRKTVDASITDILLLKKAGFSIRAHKTNPAVRDRVVSMNSALEKGLVFVNDEVCPTFAHSLETQVYKDNGEPDKSNGVDHCNDAGTYPIAYELPVSKPVIVTDIRMSA